MSIEVWIGLFRLLFGKRNDVRGLELTYTAQEVDNDMADAEGVTAADGNAPINIKVSSSTHVARPCRCG